MFTDIFNEFIDKDVEVTTNIGKSYTGTLRRSLKQEAIVISPHEGYSARRYGPVFIKESDVVSVREIFPYIDDDDEKDYEDKQMTDLPYKDAKKASYPSNPLASHDMGVYFDDLPVDEDV